MKVLILENCFKPDGSKSPDILRRNDYHELADDQAQTLIEKGWAVEKEAAADAKDEAPQAGDAPKKGKKAKGE